VSVRHWPDEVICARNWQKPADEQRLPASSGQASSGTRNDRGRLEGRDHGILKGVMITLKEHPPLESA
jgi:hypothetical protein